MNPAHAEIREKFNYQTAYQRNLGLISVEEQEKIRRTCAAVAGLGGIGGAHALALARLGFGSFILADADAYDWSNLNRQFGATVGNIGKKKIEAMRDVILSINPTAQIKLIPRGLEPSTIDAFLEGADLILDGLDFNCFDERFLLYAKARERGLWVINTAPPGFGSTLLLFDPNGMNFEDYFDFHPGMSRQELAFAFSYGISPSPLVLKYIHREAFNFSEGTFPCVSPAFFLSAGIAATEAVNLVLGKRPPEGVPWVYQFDAMRRIYKKAFYPMGMRSPWQRLRKWFLGRLVKSSRKPS